MTDTPNEQAPSTRSEWLALIREAVREALDVPPPPPGYVRVWTRQPPSEG